MPNRIPTPGVPTPAVRVSKSAQPAAKPAPTPTSLSQLKNTTSTMMNVDPSKVGTKGDLNVYHGTYGGKDWTWNKGKASR